MPLVRARSRLAIALCCAPASSSLAAQETNPFDYLYAIGIRH